jgi:hypothetical protein
MGCHAPEPSVFDNRAPSSSPTPGISHKHVEQHSSMSLAIIKGSFHNCEFPLAPGTLNIDNSVLDIPSVETLSISTEENSNQMQSTALVPHSQGAIVTGPVNTTNSLTLNGIFKI